MSKRQLERFRKILLGQMNELMGKAEGTVDDLVTDNENFPDLTDRASAEADLNFGLRVRDRERKLIMKIKEALKRVEDGSFGTCEICGEPIEVKRLEARPVTTLCIDCKIEQEREEKMRGE
jgi:DnaK suppressor protein